MVVHVRTLMSLKVGWPTYLLAGQASHSSSLGGGHSQESRLHLLYWDPISLVTGRRFPLTWDKVGNTCWGYPI